MDSSCRFAAGQQRRHERRLEDLSHDWLASNGISCGTKIESGADSITMVSFIAGAFISTASGHPGTWLRR